MVPVFVAVAVTAIGVGMPGVGATGPSVAL
jgi:hypothetical protein